MFLVSVHSPKYFYTVRTPSQVFNLSRIPSLCTQPSFYHLEMRCRSLGEVVAWKSWSPGWDHKGCINWMWTGLMSTSSSKPPLLCWEFEGSLGYIKPCLKMMKQAKQSQSLDYSIQQHGPVSGLQTQFCPVDCAIPFDYSSCLGAVFGNSQALEAKQNVGGLFSVTLDDWALILIFFGLALKLCRKQ